MADLSERGFEFLQLLGQELADGEIELPSFPDIPLRIKSVLDDPEASADQVAAVAGADPIVAATLLKVANSVAMGAMPGAQISNLPTAIARMGFKMAGSVVLSIALRQVLLERAAGKLRPHFQTLWQHTINVAAYSYCVAKRYRHLNADDAMLAGLMYDVGKIYLMMRAEDQFPDLCDDIDCLRQIMLDWHGRARLSILRNWGLAKSVQLFADEVEALQREDREFADIADVVLVANYLTSLVSQDILDGIQDINYETTPAFRRLDLDGTDIESISDESRGDVAAIVSLLGVA